ncbi:23S rRNA (guanosine(2251)-2'-O)-methyltransferase RlmB [bacterium]|nr:23S rRNA (guanosine(2251)-2'-O)-methyltransferase RlmB [bacterium]
MKHGQRGHSGPRRDRPWEKMKGRERRGDEAPREGEGGGRPFGGPRRDDNRPQGARPYAGPRRDGDRPQGARPYGGPSRDGERPQGPRPYGGPRREGDRPQGARPYGRPQRDDRGSYNGPRRDEERPQGARFGRPPREESRPYAGPRRDDRRPYGGPRRDEERPQGARSYGRPPRDENRPYGGPRRDEERPQGARPYGRPPRGEKRPHGGPRKDQGRGGGFDRGAARPQAARGRRTEEPIWRDESPDWRDLEAMVPEEPPEWTGGAAEWEEEAELESGAGVEDVEAGTAPRGRSSEAPAETEGESEEVRGVVVGFHPVRTAFELHPRKIERLLLARGQRDHRTQQLVKLAEEHHVPYQQVPKEALDRLADGAQHQGVAAKLSGAELLGEDELIDKLPENALALVVDGVQDPRNLGAILRTAAAMGVDGVFLPGHRTVGVSPAATRTAAGGIEIVPVARAGNVGQLLERLQDAGYQIVALDVRDGVPPWKATLTGPLVLVAGGEEKGIRPSVLERCAARVTIPMRELVGSLNVSVAVGIVLGETARQRGGENGAKA